MSSLWASVSPLSEQWSKNPFKIRITFEGDTRSFVSGVRLLIVGQYDLADDDWGAEDNYPFEYDIVVPSKPSNSFDYKHWLDHHPGNLAEPFTLIFQLGLVNNSSLALYSIQCIKTVSVAALLRRRPVPILLDRVYPLEVGSHMPLEISLSRDLETAWGLSIKKRCPYTHTIHVRILNTAIQTGVRSSKVTQLIASLPTEIVRAIGRNLLSNAVSEVPFFPSWLLSMSLAKKSWLHVLDEFTVFFEQPHMPFWNPTIIPNLLKAKPHWKNRIKLLMWSTFFTNNSLKKVDIDTERTAFIRSIQCLPNTLERLVIDLESLCWLHQDKESEKMKWTKLTFLNILEPKQTGDRDYLCLDDLTKSLRLFPSLRHLGVSNLKPRSDKFQADDPLNVPKFPLETLDLGMTELDCRDLKFLIPLDASSIASTKLKSLSASRVVFTHVKEMIPFFQVTSSTLRHLDIFRGCVLADGMETTNSRLDTLEPTLFDKLPSTMKKLRNIRISARYVTPWIIHNMSGKNLNIVNADQEDSPSEADEVSRHQGTCLQIEDYDQSNPDVWEGSAEREGSCAVVNRGQRLYKAIEVTEWDEIVFSRVDWGRKRLIWQLIGRLAQARGYSVTEQLDGLTLKRQ